MPAATLSPIQSRTDLVVRAYELADFPRGVDELDGDRYPSLVREIEDIGDEALLASRRLGPEDEQDHFPPRSRVTKDFVR
jgi:hypothetical protein